MVFGEYSLADAITVLKAERDACEMRLKVIPDDKRTEQLVKAIDTVNGFVMEVVEATMKK